MGLAVTSGTASSLGMGMSSSSSLELLELSSELDVSDEPCLGGRRVGTDHHTVSDIESETEAHKMPDIPLFL